MIKLSDQIINLLEQLIQNLSCSEGERKELQELIDKMKRGLK